MKRKISLLIILLCVAGAASAQKKWTLRECIDHAIANNVEIKQIELAVEGSELDLNTSRNSRLPDLDVSVGQNFNFGQSPVRTFDQTTNTWTDVYQDTQTSTTNFSVTSSVPIFAGMRITNQIKSDEFSLKAATENLKKARENLEIQVTSLYLESLFKKEIAHTYVQQAELTRQEVVRTEALVESGKAPRSQYYDIKAQLADDETNVVTSENDFRLALLNLAQALNIIDPDGFDIVEPNPDRAQVDDGSLDMAPEDIYQIAVENKPHVAEALYKLESSRMDEKVVRAAMWPTLNLGMGYSNNYYHVFSSSSNLGFGSQVRKQGNESIGLSLNIPIFNRMATRNKVRAARLAITDRELELASVKLEISKQVRQAHQSAIAAQAKLVSSTHALEAAREAYSYAQERYGVGKLTVFELNDAQTKLLKSRSAQLQAKYDFLFRTKILDFYRGVHIDIRY